LCLEVQFYVVFALTQWLVDPVDDEPARRQRRRLWVWCAWGAVALLWTAGLQLAPLWRGSFLTFWYSFVAGVMCGLAWTQPGRAVVVATAYAALIWRSRPALRPRCCCIAGSRRPPSAGADASFFAATNGRQS
jgi:peptidoglycan/LPS O-acetylase OafA/YrhL